MRRLMLIRALQRCLFFLPIRRRRILFYVNRRRGLTCNPKYIALEMRRRYGDQVEMIWATDEPDSCGQVLEQGIRVVRAGTKQHWLAQLTSGAVVVNDAFHESVILRRRQLTMNTWHAAMNYKQIGPGSIAFRDDAHRRIFALRNVQPKVYLSGSRFFTEDTSRSFGFDKKVFVPTGLPRNDVLFRDAAALRTQLGTRYALEEGIRLALYAPTFRQGYREDVYGLDFERLAGNLSARFGGQWKILYRRHYFVSGEGNQWPACVRDVSDADDMNELLAVCDVLISDYSSCLWDFSLTKRPAFIYASDLEAYRKDDRGFAYPLEKWPFAMAKDNDELEKCVLAFDEAEYAQRIEAHHADAGAYDDGHAAERAADCLAEYMGLSRPDGAR